MTQPADADWGEIERLVREKRLTYVQIADRTGIDRDTIMRRARMGGWRRGGRATTRHTPTGRRRLVRRFYEAITTKLEQMEHRMQQETVTGDGASSADHERDARTIGGLINQLAKLAEYETDLDSPAERGHDAAALAEETERYRRELVQRLERLFPPQQ